MARYKFEELEAMARMAGFDPSISPVMAAIGLAESSGNPYAHNPKYPDDSYGLFQINMLDVPGYMLGKERRNRYGLRSNEELFDPMKNLQAAKDIYENQGLGAWSVYRSGAYKDYLPDSFNAIEMPRTIAKKMATIVDDGQSSVPSRSIEAIGDSSVGRGRSSSPVRKAGAALLKRNEDMSSNNAMKGTILEYVPVGGAGLQFF